MYVGGEYMTSDALISKLKNEGELYNIFYKISTYSTINQKGLIKPKSVKLKDIISIIKSEILQKDDSIIKSQIDHLISYGLLEYTNREGVDCVCLSEIKLGSHSHSGVGLYKKILLKQEEEKKLEEGSQKLELSFNQILNPYEQRIEALTEELNEKMDKINNMIDNDIIKNIQVISVFAAIISLLFANVIGVIEFEAIGSTGLLVLNLSVLLSIFALLIFTKLLIIKDKINYKIVFSCLAIIFIITMFIFFVSKYFFI